MSPTACPQPSVNSCLFTSTWDALWFQKLIEVALPLDAINTAAAAAKRKSPKGYPTTLHTWWAQRPIAAARAVIFAQLVNDPEDLWKCQNPGKEANQQVKGHWTKARAKLFKNIEDLVLWENTNNEEVLARAVAERTGGFFVERLTGFGQFHALDRTDEQLRAICARSSALPRLPLTS